MLTLKDGARDGERLTMRQITNYELGILIPLHSQEEIDRVACWERPPQKYVSGRDEPWVSLSVELSIS